MIYIAPERHIHAFSPVPEAARARGRERIVFDALDGLEGCWNTGFEPHDVNPATGPAYIEGVRAGDVLRVSVDAIECRDEGYISLWLPRIGVVEPGRAHVRVPVADGCAVLDGMPFPIRPMVGVIGVAHPSGCATRCAGDGGGNLDTPGIEPGATLLLPTFYDGGLLSVGDLHAMQGEGEVFGQGIETGGTVTLHAWAQPGLRLTRPALLTRDGRIETLASHENLERAVEMAVADMGDLLAQCGLSPARRALLIAARGDVRISQMVNPQRTARMSLSIEDCEIFGADLSGMLP